MPKLTIVYVCILMLLLPACSLRRAGVPAKGIAAFASDSSNKALASRVHTFVQSLSPHTFSGALLVERNGEPLLGEGYGYSQWANQQAFTLETISHTAELAQQFTAAAILKLQAKGALNIEDKLDRFFSGLPLDKQGIQLQQLLKHRSGLPDEIGEGPVKPIRKELFLAQLWEEPLRYPPGEQYLYSALGYRLLAAVVEVASGMDYETYIRKELLEPAGMKNTGYVLPDYSQAIKARGQEAHFSQESALPDYSEEPAALWHIMGSSGMLSNVEDLYRWSHLLLEGKILPVRERALLWEDRNGVPAGASAYGWVLSHSPENDPLLLHNSRVGNFVSQLLFYPKEQARISLLANKANNQVEQLGLQIGRILHYPQYVPAPIPYREQKFVRMPQGDEAEHLRALVNFVQEKEPDPRQFLQTHYSPQFKEAAMEQTHLEALKGLQERLSGASLESLSQHWPAYMLTFYAPQQNTWYRLRARVEPHAPFRLTGIELETTEPF